MMSVIQNKKINIFWSWFLSHRTSFDDWSDSVLDALIEAIQQIDKRLSVEIDWDSFPRELIVTANGRIELFPLVDAIVAAAPDLTDWKMHSLKPPMGFDFITTYEGVDFDPKLLWFLPLESASEPDAIGIEVGVADLSAIGQRRAEGAVDVILRTAIGERSSSSDIQHFHIGSLPEYPEREGYIELVELPEYIRWRKSRSVG